MKITIIYDNTLFQPGLKSDWGFSALVETGDHNILFDTGANGSILLNNMKKLDIDPTGIDEVFISHDHFDHVGGLSSFLNKNNNVTIYVPVSLRGVCNARKVIHVDQAIKIHENVFSTGELDNIEQSMAVSTDKGLVLIAGCSHPEMKHILDAASQFGEIYAIIGGLHGFNEFYLFKDFGMICPTHCTQHITEIQNLYPDRYVEGGAGRSIEI